MIIRKISEYQSDALLTITVSILQEVFFYEVYPVAKAKFLLQIVGKRAFSPPAPP